MSRCERDRKKVRFASTQARLSCSSCTAGTEIVRVHRFMLMTSSAAGTAAGRRYRRQSGVRALMVHTMVL